MPNENPSTAEAHGSLLGRTFQVVITQDEDGWFIGHVPTLPGCQTQGKSVAQVKERIKDALHLCLYESVASRFVCLETITF